MENTNTFTITKEQYVALIAAWKQKEQHSAAELVIYNLLRGKSVFNGFKPRGKNVQGNNPWFALDSAIHSASRLMNCDYYTQYVQRYEHNELQALYVQRSKDAIKQTHEQFVNTFGIDFADLPELVEMLKSMPNV